MITAYPVHVWLVRRGYRRLSATVVSITVFAVLLAIIVGLIWSVSEMIGILPQYADEFEDAVPAGRQDDAATGHGLHSLRAVFSALD